MRTTIEIKPEHRARLLELAARRGNKGFSELVGEALEAYLRAETDRETLPQVLVKIRQLEETRRAAALYRSHAHAQSSDTFVSWLRKVVDEDPQEPR